MQYKAATVTTLVGQERSKVRSIAKQLHRLATTPSSRLIELPCDDGSNPLYMQLPEPTPSPPCPDCTLLQQRYDNLLSNSQLIDQGRDKAWAKVEYLQKELSEWQDRLASTARSEVTAQHQLRDARLEIASLKRASAELL